MDRVLDRLWIGSTPDFQAPLSTLGFSGVVDLRDNAPSTVSDVALFKLQNRDGDPWNDVQITDALHFISQQIQHGRVLVACAAGMSRSACMVIGYLIRMGMDGATAYETVRKVRPIIAPVPSMLKAVLSVCS